MGVTDTSQDKILALTRQYRFKEAVMVGGYVSYIAHPFTNIVTPKFFNFERAALILVKFLNLNSGRKRA